MQKEYRIIDNSNVGLPAMEIYGDKFNYQDLYKLVRKNQFMSTFELKAGSVSYNEYGNSIVGVIYYDKKELDELENSSTSVMEVTNNKIRIDTPPSEKITIEKNKNRFGSGYGGGVLGLGLQSSNNIPIPSNSNQPVQFTARNVSVYTDSNGRNTIKVDGGQVSLPYIG